MYTSGSCPSSYGSLVPGPRLVYRLDLGDSAPAGGTLTLSTCGLTSNNTVLYVGTGCPTWAASFSCLRGNNNAGELVAAEACTANAHASTLSITTTIYTKLFVQLGEFNGGDVVSGLSWRYEPPRPSPTSSLTRSRSASPSRTSSSTRTRSASPSRSTTRSKSRSRKEKVM